MTAESIYEAAAFGVSTLKNSGWVDTIAPGTELEIKVREPPPIIGSRRARFVVGAMASRSALTTR